MAFAGGIASGWGFGLDRAIVSRARVALVAAVILLALPVVGFAAPGVGFGVRAERGLTQPLGHSLSSAPEGLRAAASAVIDADRSTFAVNRRDGALTARGGGLSSVFGGSGPVVRAGDGAVGLTFVGLGRGAALSLPGHAMLVASHNEVSYLRAGVTEWYRNGPRGLEQGFVVRHGPAAAGADTWVSLAVRASTSLRPSARGSEVVFTSAAGAEPVLRYGGLTAADATGRSLPVRLALQGRTLLLRIDDKNARYPLTVDPYIQDGAALAGTGAAGAGRLGYGVAVSADGSTALVGAPHDNGNTGAAWVFVRSGTGWAQQGPKLTASGAFPLGQFGWSVALSANGSTALIGAPDDNGGSVWVFTRTGTTWAQQSSRITVSANGTANPAPGPGSFGYSVALSADGNTALVGAPINDNYVGAAWLFRRSGSAWTELGPVLRPTLDAGAQFGQAVALSADGSTAAVGAPGDQDLVGAVWLFSVTDSGWTQEGPELTGTGETTATDAFGWSLALSADGSTLLIGGTGATPGAVPIGAAYVFTRSGSTWSQQGAPLTPTDEAGSASFGSSVGLSADGNTAVIGGEGDNLNVGAAWVFTRSGSTWEQAGPKLLATGETAKDEFGGALAISADASTAVIGSFSDSLGSEGAWAFTLSGTTPGGPTDDSPAVELVHPFAQHGLKLTAGDESGAGDFGASVALSADGNTALVGAPGDNGQVGAAWVFVRSGSTWTQQGPKLTATGETGAGQFGVSVALSGDGNTAVIGAQADGTNYNGAAWVFTRSGQTWAQTAKLAPTDEKLASGVNMGAAFGESVALSTDGSTALVGGPADSGLGAAWVFVRNGSAWAQQGHKLIGLSLNAVGASVGNSFGQSVALSSNGNTALVGAPSDSYFSEDLFQNAGSAFVFTRTGTSWSQQGNALDMHFTSGAFGAAVALSSDGNTALITGPDSAVVAPDGTLHEGAAWVFTRTASIWGQFGLVVTPNDDVRSSSFGTSAALSADGDTVLIGGSTDAGTTGAAWQFDRSGFSWVQQGPKLTGGGEIGAGGFGDSAALSADASTALVGGPLDNGYVGAAWTFTPASAPGAPSDVAAAASDGQATVSFDPPDSDGGEPITSYTVTASPGGATATGSSSPITVEGLTDGTTYTFTVTATTIAGTGPASTASNTATPTAPDSGGGGGGGGGGGSASTPPATATPTIVPPTNAQAPVTTSRAPAVPVKPERCIEPKLIGDTLEAARRVLSRAHCAVGHVTHKASPHVATGRISAQSPQAGRKLAKGAKINVTVSTGKTKRA